MNDNKLTDTKQDYNSEKSYTAWWIKNINSIKLYDKLQTFYATKEFEGLEDAKAYTKIHNPELLL